MSSLDEETRGRLLRVARFVIEADLFGTPELQDAAPWPPLERRGAFVTLRMAGQLRGCVGTFLPEGELPATVRAMAVAAAHDPRFVEMPIRAAEMTDVRIEISALSPLFRLDNLLLLEIGKHGVYVRRDLHAGCYLPDVASENGWDAETFLTQCCRQKAGLDGMAWRDVGTEVYAFTVEKFCDGDL